MRVVLSEHFPDDAGAFLVGTPVAKSEFRHTKEYPPVYGLESVAHIGQRPTYDNRHRVVDVGGLHLVLNVDRNDTLI